MSYRAKTARPEERARKSRMNKLFYDRNKDLLLQQAHDKYQNDEQHREWKKKYNRERMRIIRKLRKEGKLTKDSLRVNGQNDTTPIPRESRDLYHGEQISGIISPNGSGKVSDNTNGNLRPDR